MNSNRILFLTLTAMNFLISGCSMVSSNTSAELNYKGLSAQEIAENPAFITCSEPELAYLENQGIKTDWIIYSAYKQGFFPVGESRYTSAGSSNPLARRNGAIDYAKQIGACLVYWSHNHSYTNTRTETVAYTNVGGIIPNSGGVPIMQTQYDTRTISTDFYASAFHFFAKLNPDEDFGSFLIPITDSRKLKEINASSALYVMYVRPDSNSDQLGLSTGDFILGPYKDRPCTLDAFASACIKNKIFTVLRNNKKVTLRIK